jgi:hypothetical protein
MARENTETQIVDNADVAGLEALLAETETQANEVEAAAETMPDAPVEEAKAPATKKKGSKKKAESKDEATPAPFVPVVIDGDLGALVDAVSEDDRKNMAAKVHAEFDARQKFEAMKNAENEKIQTNLKNYASKLGSLGAAGILTAISVDPAFINREISAGSRFNVYAIDKVNDLVAALETGVMRNAINIAIMKSLFKFRAAGVAFTGIAANAAVSDKIRVEKAMKDLLVRHTVSAATAPTQASSTMAALHTLGIVSNRGSKKHPHWELTDTPQTRRLEALLAA